MFLFKEVLSLTIRRLSMNFNTNFLFSLVNTLNLLIGGKWFQSNKWSLVALPLGLTFFLVNGYIPIYSPILRLRIPHVLHIRHNRIHSRVHTKTYKTEPDVSSFRMQSLKQKAFADLFWVLNTIFNLQQLRIP